MGRTVPTLNEAIAEVMRDLNKVRDGLTTREKPLWDEFLLTGHLNERAISLAVFTDPMQAMMLAMLFKQFKMIKALGGTLKDAQDTLDPKEGGLGKHMP
jgi:hypothetical protein